MRRRWTSPHRLPQIVAAFGAIAGLSLAAGGVAAASAPFGSARSSVHSAIGSSVAAESDRLAAFRFGNLVDGLTLLSVNVDGKMRMGAIPSGAVSDYAVMPAGRHTVSVKTTLGSIRSEIELVAGVPRTVLLLGPPARPVLRSFGDRTAFAVGRADRRAASLRIVNASTEPTLRMDVGGRPLVASSLGATDAVDVATGSATLLVRASSAVPPGNVDWSQNVTTDHGASVIAVVSGSPGSFRLRSLASPALSPTALSAQVEQRGSKAFVEWVLAEDAVWLCRVMAGLVVLLVVLATGASLATFRAESLEDRVRNRMQ